MGLKKLAQKVAEYNVRFERGKASKIKPSHVERVLAKLRRKSADLEADIANARTAFKKARLRKKLEIATSQIERAEWLLKEITNDLSSEDSGRLATGTEQDAQN